MKKHTIVALVISISAVVTGNSLSFAADKQTEAKGPSKEQRQKMAEAHQKMADCLNSDKPMGECKDEMMKSCHDMMGKDGCPMMSEKGGMMGHGSMHHNKTK